MPNLYLRSTELPTPYEPRLCRIKRRLRSEIRSDLALVSIEPPLPKETYRTDSDLSELILATRLENSSLFPEPELPSAVYVCRLNASLDADSDVISSDDLSILDWGELNDKPGKLSS
jgi:hypothetical protein